MKTVMVNETFGSIQGESSYAGMPCFFIRLAGCNLRCVYCDTVSAREGGEAVSIGELVDRFEQSGLPLGEVTGGEPLRQAGTPELLRALARVPGRRVLVETNGSIDVGAVPPGVVAVVDVKTPASGAGGSFLDANLDRLRPMDEVKFVLCDRADFDWAREFVTRHRLAERVHAVFFSPAHGTLDPAALAGWLELSRLPVRLHLQLHKALGMK
jgi:7-carboxy-7-deazaguanine synthase